MTESNGRHSSVVASQAMQIKALQARLAIAQRMAGHYADGWAAEIVERQRLERECERLLSLAPMEIHDLIQES